MTMEMETCNLKLDSALTTDKSTVIIHANLVVNSRNGANSIGVGRNVPAVFFRDSKRVIALGREFRCDNAYNIINRNKEVSLRTALSLFLDNSFRSDQRHCDIRKIWSTSKGSTSNQTKSSRTSRFREKHEHFPHIQKHLQKHLMRPVIVRI